MTRSQFFFTDITQAKLFEIAPETSDNEPKVSDPPPLSLEQQPSFQIPLLPMTLMRPTREHKATPIKFQRISLSDISDEEDDSVSDKISPKIAETAQLESDEALAKKLQAQFDKEEEQEARRE